MDAQGALDSFLGRLTTVLVSEAQLLGGVRGDVESIKDEMECMNSLLLDLTDAQHRNRQVQTWMKQVTGLTRDYEGNVELYIHYVRGRPGGKGILGYLRRIPRFLRTIPVRHQIATRIRELQVRAHQVGDRRLRYGVTLPTSSQGAAGAETHDDDVQPPLSDVGEEEHHRRRRTILAFQVPDEDEAVVSKGIDLVIKWLSERPPLATALGDNIEPRLRVIPIATKSKIGDHVAQGVYEHSWVVSSFDCKAWVRLRSYDRGKNILADILEKVTAGGQQEVEDEEELARKLQEHLKGKRFLIVLEHVVTELQLEGIRSALLHAEDDFHPASAIIMTTRNFSVAKSYSPYITFKTESSSSIWNSAINKLAVKSTDTSYISECIWSKAKIKPFNGLNHDAFAMKMFLHLLYVNPHRTRDDLSNYFDAVKECKRLNRSSAKQVLKFCYNELPSKYKSCLLYLSIFPKGHAIRTTGLARRWIAEGLIVTDLSKHPASAVDEAERYLDVLATRGFVHPAEIGAAGDIKSFTVYDEVREFIARIARDVNFVDGNLRPDLAHHLSIHNRIGLQAYHPDVDVNGIIAFLPSLAASSQWQMLKVLDLEGCKSLTKHHLKSICKILLLKYLSLRNTDVTELPKQIKELQCLETLDIRQTKVQVLAKKAIVLPLLKHFLAGHKVAASIDASGSEESISAVKMPLCVQSMKNLEILSHVQVSNSDSELAGITQLLKLRKLGVALHGKKAKLSDLFRQIEKLHRCLRSLSIRIDQPATSENHDAAILNALTPPKFIESLNISGLTSGLPHLIQELHQLAKLTLTETYLKEDALRILGKLRGLRCLRLQHKSYTESELAFEAEEFKSLNFLLVDNSDITSIIFVTDAAPNLERIVWSIPTTACISGVTHLKKLEKFELKGDYIPPQVWREIPVRVLKQNGY